MNTTAMTELPPYLAPSRSFQGLILALQRYWADWGCVILQPYDMEVGAGTFHPATTLRALRRKSQPAAALLSVPGDPQAVAAGHPGPLSQVAGRHRHRSRDPRHPLR